jgi:nucleoside-diphosphate-sugar epimerase
MLVVITGSSGQIGTNLAHRCLDAGHSVLGFDLRPNPWSTRIPTCLLDLAAATTEALCERLAAACDSHKSAIVFHLAAHAKVHQLVHEPVKAFENVLMLRPVLELCRKQSLPLIYASSREIYGNQRLERTGEADADFSAVASPYAASKASCESMILAYARCYGLRYLIFRLSNVYGRYDNDIGRMSRVVPLFMDQIASGRPVTVFGADKVLDFTYIDDCIDGLMAGLMRLLSGQISDQTFNLAYGQGHSLIKLAEYIGQALGMRPEVRIASSLQGEIGHYVADIGKARALLEFAPLVGLREGVQRTLEWARETQPPAAVVVGATGPWMPIQS